MKVKNVDVWFEVVVSNNKVLPYRIDDLVALAKPSNHCTMNLAPRAQSLTCNGVSVE